MSDIDESKTIAAAFSIDAVAELMSMHRSTVERLLESRTLGFYKIGRRRVIGQAHLNQYLAQIEPITESHRR
jgi:excisionase family DNA binding protein